MSPSKASGRRRPASTACDWWDAVDQGEGLGDVVDVRCGRDDFERGAVSVADQVVFAARLPPVDRRRTGVGSHLSAAANWSDRTRIPVPGVGVARRCRCAGRTGRLADTTGPAPAAALATFPARAAVAVRSAPTRRRPRSKAEYSRHHERPNHHIGHSRPGDFNKILLRADLVEEIT